MNSEKKEMTQEEWEALPEYKRKQMTTRAAARLSSRGLLTVPTQLQKLSYLPNRKTRRSPEFKAALASKKAQDAIEAAKKVEVAAGGGDSLLARSEDLRDTEQEAGEKESAPE